jgi:ferredoxin
MIVAQRKPFAEIEAMLAPYKKVLIAGCGTCVAVCLTGGEKEVGLLAAELSIASQIKGRSLILEEATVERQCDREFLSELKEPVGRTEAVLSLACGAGIQFLAEMYDHLPVLPGVDTTFIGVNEAVGFWTERCRACHECVLDQTGGICPKTMCAKGLLNGPCGGTVHGQCEVDQEKPCAWTQIYQRLERTGRLDLLRRTLEPGRHDRQTTPAYQTHAAYKRRFDAHA